MKAYLIKTLKIDDTRGYNAILYDSSIASQLPSDFHIVQINQAFSTKAHTFRGLHYQTDLHAQAKHCFCLSGSVFNVALNLSTGEAFHEILKPGMAMFIPRGYAHGYITLEDNVLFQWCVDNDFHKPSARILHYSSVDGWPVEPETISEKDAAAEAWSADLFTAVSDCGHDGCRSGA